MIRTISLSSFRRPCLTAALVITVTGSALAGFGARTVAQDGTDAATPAPPTTCIVVNASGSAEVVANTPAAEPDASPVEPVFASPVASPIASPVASPVISPMASPMADPLATDLEAVVTSLFGCLNERKYETYAQVTSDVWRGGLFGSSQRLPADQFVALAQTLPEVDTRLVSLDAVERVDADTAHAEVTWISAYQQRSAEWIFQLQDIDGIPTWIAYSQTLLPFEAPGDAEVIT